MYRFGPSGGIDPSSQTEDLGDDAIKASEYGIKNLKFVLGLCPTQFYNCGAQRKPNG